MELRFTCPFCQNRGKSPDRKKHLYVNPELNSAHCFRCGYGTKHAREMCERERLDVEASLWQYVKTAGQREPCVLPAEYSQDWNSFLGPRALEYLLARGLSLPLIHAYELGHCDTGPYAMRVIVPVYEREVLVYFQARDWTGSQEPKYLGPAGKGIEPLFNFERAAAHRVLVLVEGIFDALRLPDYGVALLGKELSEKKREKILAARPKAILVILDADARDYAEQVKNEFVAAVPLVARVPFLSGKDLGDAPESTIAHLHALCQRIETDFQPQR